MSVANKLMPEPWRSRKTKGSARVRSFFTKREMPKKVMILDQELIREFIQDRRNRGIVAYDEVWEEVYIVPPLATNPHQGLVAALTFILFNVIAFRRKVLRTGPLTEVQRTDGVPGNWTA